MKPEKYKTDFYDKLAIDNGYRARSAYKLLQINQKYKIFPYTKYVLDLGSAPGSWVQVAMKELEDRRRKLVMGVDYKRMGEIKGAKLVSANIFSKKFDEIVWDYFPKGIDVILSDMSPKISGNKYLDSAKTIELVEKALSLVDKFLNNKGNFVAKVFQCPELDDLKEKVSISFKSVFLHKPKASRRGNREIYLIAKGYQKKF